MKAEEARKITFEHSKRMKKIYEAIEKSAKLGSSSTILTVGEASTPELEVLKANGYKAVYETSETDGVQYILVEW